MIEQIPAGRVAGRIERAADERRGMILKPDETGPVAGLLGAGPRIRRAAAEGKSVRVTAAEVTELGPE